MTDADQYHIVDVTKPLDRLHQVELIDVVRDLLSMGYFDMADSLLETLSARIQCDDFADCHCHQIRH